MKPPDPMDYTWWLASRASALTALLVMTMTVGAGLAMAGKVSRRPGLKRVLMAVHEHGALIALVAISVHGITLLGDRWLNPGVQGIAVPFTLSYRPAFTGIGMVGGYLAALLGLSFYMRRRIGAKLWRRLHRFTVVAWALSVVHTVGAGSDGGTLWLRGALLVACAPIIFLFLMRILPHDKVAQTVQAPIPG